MATLKLIEKLIGKIISSRTFEICLEGALILDYQMFYMNL